MGKESMGGERQLRMGWDRSGVASNGEARQSRTGE